MAKKQSKNLQKVQDMLDGNSTRNIQVGGYYEKNVKRKIGDIWTDSDGIKWEQKEGYYSKVTKTAIGVFSKVCGDCKKPCTEQRDKDTWVRMDRCYHCQINFEIDLKSKGKWEEWAMELEKNRWETVLDEFRQLDKENKENNPNDKSLVTALSNSNQKDAIKINKKMTNQ
tara:strand:- start:683 stop:1192 length:510 start_codon:yes stop_codon:yes gene_type:complete